MIASLEDIGAMITKEFVLPRCDHGIFAAMVAAAIASYRESPSLAFEPAGPTLEDVFIDLMNRSKDNFP